MDGNFLIRMAERQWLEPEKAKKSRCGNELLKTETCGDEEEHFCGGKDTNARRSTDAMAADESEESKRSPQKTVR